MDVPLGLNCTEEELQVINSFVENVRRRTGPTGLIYSGCSASFSNNRIEGRLLATAGRIRQSKRKTRVVHAAEVAFHLSANQSERLLENEFLFLPDLNIWPAIFGSDRLLNRRLYEVLAEREASQFPTIVYIESAFAFGEEFASLLTCRFRKANLAKIMPVPHRVLHLNPQSVAILSSGGPVGVDC